MDVNVHPNKMEMRFSNGEEMYHQLVALISERLRESELIPKVAVKEERKEEKRPVQAAGAVPEHLRRNVWKNCGLPLQKTVLMSVNIRSGSERSRYR